MPNWWDMPITQGFGPTDEPLDSGYAGYAHFNKGLDYGTPAGTPVTANVGGKVIAAGPGSEGWGTRVWVQDANGLIHNYGHLDSAAVQVGQQVTPGMLLGSSGNTGNSTGPHLSYDVWKQGPNGYEYIDPSQFIGGASAPPPQGAPPMVTPQQEDLAQKYLGVPYAQLSGPEQAFIDGKVKSLYGTEGLGVTAADSTKSPEDRTAYNPATGNQEYQTYDPVSKTWQWTGVVASRPPIDPATVPVKPQGAVKTEDLVGQGASFAIPGEAKLPNGRVYTKNPDGTWDLRPASATAGGTTITGAGINRLFGGGLAGVNAANTTTTPPPASPVVGATSQSAPSEPSDSPLNRMLTAEQIQAAAGQPGIQDAEILGAAEKMYTGLGGPLPITYGGVNAGGGLTPIPGSEISPLRPQFGGFTQGNTGNKISIGTGFDPALILAGAGLAPTGTGKDVDTALNIQSGRQAAMDNPMMQFKDLPAMQAVNSRGDAPKGQYASALSDFSKAAGAPLSALDLAAIPNYSREVPFNPDEFQFNATGGSVIAGMDDTEPPVIGSKPTTPRMAINSDGSGYVQTMNRQGQTQYMAPQGGAQYTPEQWMAPSWEDFTNASGGTAGLNSYNITQQQVMFNNLLKRIYGHNVAWNGDWTTGGKPPSYTVGDQAFNPNFTRPGGFWARGSQAPQFANGGQQILDEPVLGIGMQSGDPKFMAGEAGKELLTFTPMPGAGQPQMSMPPMGGMPPQAGMPQAGMPPMPMGGQQPAPPMTDPRIMSLFAQTAAKRMKPMTPVAGGY